MRVDRAPFALRLDIDMDRFGCGTTGTSKRSRDHDEDVVDEEALRMDKVRRPIAYPNVTSLTPFPEIAKRQRDCSITLCTPPPAFQTALTTISVPPLLRFLSSAPSS
jgi:hypothetical protein